MYLSVVSFFLCPMSSCKVAKLICLSALWAPKVCLRVWTLTFLRIPAFLDTVASAPGCPQTTFVVKFRAEPLRQEGNPMFGPGEYRPDPSAGITAPADL